MSPEETPPLERRWRAWVLEQLAHGADLDLVIEALRERGCPEPLARAQVLELARASVSSLASQLRRELAGESLVELAADRFEPSTFWREHWELNRPLVLRGYAASWPASRWTLEGLAARFGDTPVEIEVERDPTRHFEGRWVERPLDGFIAGVRAGAGNHSYCIARNKNLERRLRPLLDDVVVDPTLFEPARLVGGSSLWIGPKGTLTPLHYDTTNILFVQLVGAKRFWLVSPDWCGLMYRLDAFYVRDDLAALPPEAPYLVDLAPGDALFIPVGWFHRVLALAPSVSFSLLCFRRPNDFSWLHPARVLTPSRP